MDVEEAKEESQDTFAEFVKIISRLESKVDYLNRRVVQLESQAVPTLDDIYKEMSKRMMQAVRNSGIR